MRVVLFIVMMSIYSFGVHAKTITVICEHTDSKFFYGIDIENKIISVSFTFGNPEQLLESDDYEITFANENIIFGEYSDNHDLVVPPGKMQGQIDRMFIVFHRKNSIVKQISMSANKYYSTPDTTFISGFEKECITQF